MQPILNSEVMQRIRLNTIIYHQGKYCVFLDKDTRYYFVNKRKAADFLTQQSQRNDMAVLFISESLNDLQTLYNLFNLVDSDYKFKLGVKDCIDYLNNRVAWITAQHSGPNCQALIMQGLRVCFDELAKGFNLVMKKAQSRNDTLTKRRCLLRCDIVRLYSQQLYAVHSEAAQSAVKLRVV